MSDIHWFQEARQFSQLALGARQRTAAELMDAARRTTGLGDFGPEPIEEPLGRLLQAYQSEGRLNLLGRVATHWDNLRLLTNRLILRERELADPSILERPVEQPIFIVGLPRSGTSFLHQALAQDGENLVMRSWQTVYPYPDHPAAGRGAGPERVQSEYSLFHRLAPELKKVHPVHARSPAECGEITAHSFRSLRFDTTYDTPSYRRWLKGTGQRDALRLHRRFLQHLQGEQRGRWVLKWPDHVFSLDALRAVYPGARIVFSHRDPVKVMPSLAHLTEVMRRPFVKRIDRKGIGRQVSADWADGTERMISAYSARLWPPDQVFHVHFKSFVADPVSTVRKLYDHFGMGFTPELNAKVGDFVRKKPNGGYARNVYCEADYGLKAGEQRERFRDYMNCFDVEAEVAA